MMIVCMSFAIGWNRQVSSTRGWSTKNTKGRRVVMRLLLVLQLTLRRTSLLRTMTPSRKDWPMRVPLAWASNELVGRGGLPRPAPSQPVVPGPRLLELLPALPLLSRCLMRRAAATTMPAARARQVQHSPPLRPLVTPHRRPMAAAARAAEAGLQ